MPNSNIRDANNAENKEDISSEILFTSAIIAIVKLNQDIHFEIKF